MPLFFINAAYMCGRMDKNSVCEMQQFSFIYDYKDYKKNLPEKSIDKQYFVHLSAEPYSPCFCQLEASIPGPEISKTSF